ncbi:hypothetical protein RZS08_28430, partial [Arthrospira platensis SPKY1]|nr:hypothetical protein [Arthrospira platensis SPKY1]
MIDNGNGDEPMSNHSHNPHFDDVLNAHLSRRSALKGSLGASIAALFGGAALTGCATTATGSAS